jgi:transcription elongation factor GreA
MAKKAKNRVALPHVYQVSKEGFERLKQQLAGLRQEYAELRSKLIELRQLKDAEEYDLVDDAIRVSYLEKKIQQLQFTLAHCKVTSARATADMVQLGSRVKLQYEDKELECLLVSALEADPSQGRISDESPLGRALLGKMINALVEVVAPRRKTQYRIVHIA